MTTLYDCYPNAWSFINYRLKRYSKIRKQAINETFDSFLKEQILKNYDSNLKK